MSTPELQKNILTTVTYYDVMDYPMTAFEIWKYLTRVAAGEEGGKFSLEDVIKELDGEKLEKFIEEFHGFYFLKGRLSLVEQRIERNKIAERKFKLLLKATRWLKFAPFVRMIAVTGRMAMKNTEAKSDLDLLVVLKHGKIWTGRTAITFLAQIIGRRRHGSKIKDRICLNYFITTKSLEINLKDIFSASEYSFIFPIFGFGLFRKFQERNSWILKYKPNFQIDEAPNLKVAKENNLIRLVRGFWEVVLRFDFIENSLKRWQAGRIEKNPKTHQPGSLILASDEMLIFLPDPQSPKVFEKFQKRLSEISK